MSRSVSQIDLSGIGHAVPGHHELSPATRVEELDRRRKAVFRSDRSQVTLLTLDLMVRADGATLDINSIARLRAREDSVSTPFEHHRSNRQVAESLDRLAALGSELGLDDRSLCNADREIHILFDALGHEDLGELFAGAVENGVLAEAQAAYLLGVVPWCGRTNGADLQATLERWLLQAVDPLRVGLALAPGHSTFPFREPRMMNEVLTKVSESHDQYAERCRTLMAARRAQGV